MNIFEDYLNKITVLIIKNQKFLELGNLNNFKGVIVETPPSEFNFDLSCNVSLVLGKINKINAKLTLAVYPDSCILMIRRRQ